MVGPVIGGYVYAKLNFQIVALVASAIAYSMAVIAALTMLINWPAVGRRIRKTLHHLFPSRVAAPKVHRRPSETESSQMMHSVGDENEENIFQPPTAETGALIHQRPSSKSYGSITTPQDHRLLDAPFSPLVVI